MDINRISNVYLLSSILSLFIMPITGVVALSYAISAKWTLIKDKESNGIERLLKSEKSIEKNVNLTLGF